MASKVPISVENIAFERLNLSRHYLTVDCDFTCFLVLNPSGVIPSEGTDICALHVGAWQIDAWTLLTKKDFPNQAGFSACLVWDKTLVVEGTNRPSVVESDIDTANSVSTLKGQPVNITGFSMPDGSSLPVSLVSGVYEDPISISNPLPVCDLRKSFHRFSVGSVYSRFTLLEIGSSLERVENGFEVYVCSPCSWSANLETNDIIAVHWGKGVHYLVSSNHAQAYSMISCYVELFRGVESGVIDHITCHGKWADGNVVNPIYSSVTEFNVYCL